ncbi:MAG: hypothetical protein GEU83_14525 [Pseudonocardiaceae bacterium]|nr:hypothetical protein [Pseudonocardiaceae bacterium]
MAYFRSSARYRSGDREHGYWNDDCDSRRLTSNDLVLCALGHAREHQADTAREVLDAAVVYERQCGASWAAIGEALDVTRQSAHERFGPTVTAWDTAIDEPLDLSEGAADPDATAARLDQWCAQHAPVSTRALAADAGLAETMVSAGLPSHTPASEAASVLRQARHLTERGATPGQREQYAARKQAVLRDADQTDQARSGDPFAADIAHRARIARAHHDGHPSGAWSTGEQLAVALVLRDARHLEAMGYTPQQAAQRVLDGMVNPPADLTAWLDGIRAALESRT